jgi:hypothetical protein
VNSRYEIQVRPCDAEDNYHLGEIWLLRPRLRPPLLVWSARCPDPTTALAFAKEALHVYETAEQQLLRRLTTLSTQE